MSVTRQETNYVIIHSGQIEEVESEVRQCQRDGWNCNGGLSVVVISNAPYFAQSMVRKKG